MKEKVHPLVKQIKTLAFEDGAGVPRTSSVNNTEITPGEQLGRLSMIALLNKVISPTKLTELIKNERSAGKTALKEES